MNEERLNMMKKTSQVKGREVSWWRKETRKSRKPLPQLKMIFWKGGHARQTYQWPRRPEKSFLPVPERCLLLPYLPSCRRSHLPCVTLTWTEAQWMLSLLYPRLFPLLQLRNEFWFAKWNFCSWGKKNNNKEILGYGLKGPFHNSEPKCVGKPKGWYKGPIIVNSPQKSWVSKGDSSQENSTLTVGEGKSPRFHFFL